MCLSSDQPKVSAVLKQSAKPSSFVSKKQREAQPEFLPIHLLPAAPLSRIYEFRVIIVRDPCSEAPQARVLILELEGMSF